MPGDPPGQSADSRIEFLSEFSGPPHGAGKGQLTLNPDGTIRYVEPQNPHCAFEFLGALIVVTDNQREYSLTYRYVSLNTAHRKCGQGDTTCLPNFIACQQAETKANQELGKLRNRTFVKGADPYALQLPP